MTGILQHADILLPGSFNLNKVDTRAVYCFTNRQRIIFLASYKGFHVPGRYQSEGVSHRSEGSAPEVRSRAGFHRDKRSGSELSNDIRQC